MGQAALQHLIDDFREGDHLSPQRMSKRLNLPLADFAKLARLHRSTLARSSSPAVQARLEPIARILAQAEALTGDAGRAIIWFRYQPIAAHDGLTAQDLVRTGDCATVLAYLEDQRDGAYA